jgi:recombination protein RecT
MSNQLTVQDQIKHSLSAMAPQLKAALPPHINVERFIRVAQTAILTTPAIMNCERNSLFAACLKSAQDGLLPDGKEAALVSFRDKAGNSIATYMPMVAGILKKVRNSGELSSITSQIVYEKDPFKYWVDEKGEHLNHEPNIMSPDRGGPVGVYALATTKDGAVYIEVLTFEDIEKIRNSSRSKDSGPWKDWPEEMARKSAIRRLSKRLPMSTDLEEVIQHDDQFYDLKRDQQTEDKKPVSGQPNRLNSLIGKANEKQTEQKTDVETEVSDGDPV